jgi:hypothetical protein
MWQAQRFVGEHQERVLAEMLAWLDENEDVIMEFQAVRSADPDGAHVYVVAYRAKSFDAQVYPV